MLNLARTIGLIAEHFHQSASFRRSIGSDESRFAQYYTSMYLIQDSMDSLLSHRKRGFSDDSLDAYIELWGILQALIIQQDSIAELYEAVSMKPLETKELEAWRKLRELRNTLGGHPSKKDRPKTQPLARSFLGRKFGGYDALSYESWRAPGKVTYPSVNFGGLIDDYVDEVIPLVEQIYATVLSRSTSD